MKCNHCGTDIKAAAERCTACGQRQSKDPTPSGETSPSSTLPADASATSPDSSGKTRTSPPEEPETLGPRDNAVLPPLPLPVDSDSEQLGSQETIDTSNAALHASADTLASPRSDKSGSGRLGGTERSSSAAERSATGELKLNSVFGGRYCIEKLIGQGGMGLVYRARDLEIDKTIALKLIRGSKETDAETIHRFKQELILARGITHKNVVRIHDMGEVDGIKFFTMQYVDGSSLKDYIRQKGRRPEQEAVTILRQILAGLEEAHSQGVIHRDLKPQNIMMTREGTPIIMDFGIARSSASTSDLTETGAVIGTPDYMSPEQVKGEKAGPESDLFSFGVIMYELLTGELPYQGESAISVVTKRLTEKPRAPREIVTQLPAYLERMTLKCLERNPALRYHSAKEVLEDLARQTVDSSLTLRLREAVRGSRARLAATLAVVGLGAVLLYAVLRVGEPSESSMIEAETQTIGIVPFTNAAGDAELDWLRAGLPDMLVSDFAQSQFVRPVSADRTLKVLRALGIEGQSRFDEVALESISESAPADSVLYGQFTESGETLRLDLTLRRAGSGLTIPISVEGVRDDVFSLVDEITERVKSHLDLTAEQLRRDHDRPVSQVKTASIDALRSYQQGVGHLREGANRMAIESLLVATRADPNFAMAFSKLAEAHLNAGEGHEAESIIEKASKLADEQELPLPERYQIHAVQARVLDDHEQAARTFVELAEIYPNDPDIQLGLARANEELGSFPDALIAYRRAMDLAPDYGEAHLGMGWVLIFSGRPDEAIQLLEESVTGGRFQSDPETLGNIHAALGQAYRETNELDESRKHYDSCLSYRRQIGDRRGEAVALARMAPLHVAEDDFPTALRVIDEAITIASELGDRASESDFLSDQGLIHKLRGDFDQALQSYRSSMAIESERDDHSRMAMRLNTIAEIYTETGRYDDSIIYLEQAKTHLAQTHDLRDKAVNFEHIGLVRMAQGLYERAVEAFLQAQPLFKEAGLEAMASVVQRNLAAIYQTQGRYGDAHSVLRAALEGLKEHHGEAHDITEAQAQLAELAASMGLLKEAELALSEADRPAAVATGHGEEPEEHTSGDDHHGGGHNETTPELWFARARVAKLAGRDEEAAQAFEKANYEANLSQRKAIAVTSRIELGKLFLREGKVTNAQRLLERTLSEAQSARLRVQEAEATVLLAEIALGVDAEHARELATQAVDIAKRFDGRPLLAQAYSVIARSLDRPDSMEDSIDAHLRAAEHLEWMRAGLAPEHVKAFTNQSESHELILATVHVLDAAGRGDTIANFKKWVEPSARSDN